MIQISTWELLLALVGLLVVFFGGVWAVFSLFLNRLDARFIERDDAIAALKKSLEHIDRDVHKLRTELPTEYVRREDWIRFSGTLDAKLDRLRDWQENIRVLLMQVVAKVEALGDKADGR